MTKSTSQATAPAATDPAPWRPDPDKIVKAINRRSFATLATASEAGRPHVAGVLYAMAEGDLYVSTMRSSRKARNIAARPEVGVTVIVRRLPVGPPSTIQFQASATILDAQSPEIRDLVAAGHLEAITGHGELELPGGCFLRIRPNRRLLTYGLGMSLWRLIRDPLSAGGVVELG